MDHDTLALIKEFAPPVLSGALGFGGAALRFYLRIRKLEANIKTFRLSLKTQTETEIALGERLADFVKRLETMERIEVRREIDTLKSGMKLEIDHHREELEEMINEIRSTIRSVEDSSHDFAKEAALAQFMAQQHTRWEQIQRTLGRIEGFLDKGADDGFPRRR